MPSSTNGGPNDIEVVGLDGVEAVLHEYRRVGGVVDFGVVRTTSLEIDDERGHRFAAAAMIDQAPFRWASIEAVTAGDRGFRYEADVASATHERIDVEEFVGPYYDWEAGDLLSPWSGGWIGSPGYEGGSRAGSEVTGFTTHGYADSFSDSPDVVRAPGETLSSWFRAINEHLFGGLDSKLVVLRWSTDWSDYFEAGLEWFGAHCWTVQRPGSPVVTAIGVSTTD